MKRLIVCLVLLLPLSSFAQNKGPDQRFIARQYPYKSDANATLGSSITLTCPTAGKEFHDYDLTETASTPTLTLSNTGCFVGQWIRILPLRTGAGSFGQPTISASGLGSGITWDIHSAQPQFDTAASKLDSIGFLYESDGKFHELAWNWDGSGTAAITQYALQAGGASGFPFAQVGPSATSGAPLVSQGNAANPAFGQITVTTDLPGVTQAMEAATIRTFYAGL